MEVTNYVASIKGVGSPDGAGVLLTMPEWSAMNATDKNLSGSGSGVAPGYAIVVTYAVPVGKTLFITQMGGASFASAVGDAELNQICLLELYNETTGDFPAGTGGNGGAAMVFNKPIVINGGETVDIWLGNVSNHNCELWAFFSGYEV